MTLDGHQNAALVTYWRCYNISSGSKLRFCLYAIDELAQSFTLNRYYEENVASLHGYYSKL